MDYKSWKGNAKIGFSFHSALANLKVTKDKLTLNIFLYGVYSFKMEEIISIDRNNNSITIMTIYHKKFTFGYKGNPGKLLKEIQELGFIPCGYESNIANRKRLPIRFSTIIFLILLLAGFIKIIQQIPQGNLDTLSIFSGILGITMLYILCVFLLSIFTLKLKVLQFLFLKPGRSVEEIRSELYSIRLLAGSLIIFGLLHFIFTLR